MTIISILNRVFTEFNIHPDTATDQERAFAYRRSLEIIKRIPDTEDLRDFKKNDIGIVVQDLRNITVGIDDIKDGDSGDDEQEIR